MALYHSPDYQICFKSIGLLVQEKKFNIDFQDGGYLGLPIRMILTIFDLKVPPILPCKFQVDYPFHSEVHSRFSSWRLWWPYWISDQNKFSYFLSPSHPDTSYYILSKLAFLFRRRSADSSHLGFQSEQF